MGINLNFGALLPKFGQQEGANYSKPATFAGAAPAPLTPSLQQSSADVYKKSERTTPEEDTRTSPVGKAEW